MQRFSVYRITHFISFPFFSVNRIVVFTRDAKTDGLVAFDSRNVITEYTECDKFGIQFLLRIVDGEAEHLFAIAPAAYRVINYHKAETDKTFIL